MSTYKKYKRNIKNKGGGRINPILSEEISNLCFVVGNKVLGDDISAVIMSLVDEFNVIAQHDLKHDLELSQSYAVIKKSDEEGIMECGNCEIVLKYVDTTICIKNGRIVSTKEDESKEIDCDVSHGVVRFYIKQKENNTYKYTPIRIVRIQVVKSLNYFTEALYQNNEEISKLEEATKAALSVGQSQIIKQNIQKGGSSDATKMVNQLIENAKNASVSSQFKNTSSEQVMPDVPSLDMVHTANAVAKTVAQSNMGEQHNLTTVLVPGNEPISLSDEPNTHHAILNKQGIVLDEEIQKVKPLNRANILVDANLAILPKEHLEEKAIPSAEQSKKSESIFNKLKSYAKQAYGDIKNMFTKSNHNLSVMTPHNNSGITVPSSTENQGLFPDLKHHTENTEGTMKINKILDKSENREYYKDFGKKINRELEDFGKKNHRGSEDLVKNIRRRSEDLTTNFKRDAKNIQNKYNEEINNIDRNFSLAKEKGKDAVLYIDRNIKDLYTKFNRDFEDLQKKYNQKIMSENMRETFKKEIENLRKRFNENTDNILKQIRKTAERGSNHLKNINRKFSEKKRNIEPSPTSVDNIPSDFSDSSTSYDIFTINSNQKNKHITTNRIKNKTSSINSTKKNSNAESIFNNTKEKFTNISESENPLKNVSFSDIFTEDNSPRS